MYFSSFEAGNCVTPVYLDPGMHSGLEVKGLIKILTFFIKVTDTEPHHKHHMLFRIPIGLPIIM